MPTNFQPTIIDEKAISALLEQQPQKVDIKLVREIFAKALELKGLSFTEVATLLNIEDRELLTEMFQVAKQVKEDIYGKRLVIFAPLYISNLCTNECSYCAFRVGNKALKRRALTQQEISEETKLLIQQGQKRILLVAGESYTPDSLQYILDAIATIYATKSVKGEIRRVNVNIAPLTVEDFHKLKAASIGTYQIFQETYHKDTYKKVHVGGRKTDYYWRLGAVERAIQAGIDDVGIGVLFGLANWRFEVLAMLQHIAHLNKMFGIGPHTISIPRIEPASGSVMASAPPNVVSDKDFCKLIAILRLAVPYTGLILSTRESAVLRREAFALGISQISAGSRTSPGGYADHVDEFDASQFALGDHRTLDEIVQDIVTLGYIPSFCTACYRLGRTGEDFMTLAKTGKIKNMCFQKACWLN